MFELCNKIMYQKAFMKVFEKKKKYIYIDANNNMATTYLYIFTIINANY